METNLDYVKITFMKNDFTLTQNSKIPTRLEYNGEIKILGSEIKDLGSKGLTIPEKYIPTKGADLIITKLMADTVTKDFFIAFKVTMDPDFFLNKYPNIITINEVAASIAADPKKINL